MNRKLGKNKSEKNGKVVSNQNTQFLLSRKILARNLAFFFFFFYIQKTTPINSNFKLLFPYLFYPDLNCPLCTLCRNKIGHS